MRGVLELSPPFHLLLGQRSVLCYILRTPLTLFHLHPLEYTPQFMVCIRCSELIYRYRAGTLCALFVRSCPWSWRSLVRDHPATCSVCYNQPLTLVLLQGAQLIEKIRKCPLLTTV